ncbi:MAG TPA: hypothetical protein DCS93_35885 [Microscillaceae bacterium]|nr:hypothetical protein [Microscillaceae bacterium]
MFLLKDQKKQPKAMSLPFRGALLSSGVIAFAGLGDAFLYPLLPIYGKDMGFSVFVIGLLLSVNRFVRIIANTHVANLVNKLGMKKVLIACAALAVATTLLYGLQVGLALFFLARVAWGICYSGLKIATLNYAAQAKKEPGLAFGLTQSIKSLGPLLVLFLGPILVQALGVEKGIFVIALLSMGGVALAFALPNDTHVSFAGRVKAKTTFYPNANNLLVFILSITIDGILVVTLSRLLATTYPDAKQLLVFVAFYLLLKKLFTTVLSMIGGVISLRVPVIKLYNIAIGHCLVGVLLIVLGFALPGILIAFFFNAVVVTFSPLIAISQQNKDKNSLQAISGVSTWWDLGAAIGAFLGIYLMESLGAQRLFLTLFILILVLFVNFIKQYANAN